MKNVSARLVLYIFSCLIGLVACGQKGPLVPPENQENDFPTVKSVQHSQ